MFNEVCNQKNTLLKISLLLLTFMILGIVILGGITRLTGSGLSIVDWKPLMGILPPLSATEWMNEFSKYQQSPEFQKVNFGMSLADFKAIFWLEYVHRLWGRLLAIVLLIPTFLIIFKKQKASLWPYVVLLWTLGLAQGFMGWLMVKSGLYHDPHVSPYRLAAHLLLGFAVFSVALWMTLKLFQPSLQLFRQGFSEKAYKKLMRLCLLASVFVLLTAFMGALVAGLKAGLLYNTFPLMGNDFVPPELFTLTPWWLDMLQNPVTVQFIHRWLALLTAFLCVAIWVYGRSEFIPPLLSNALVGMAFVALLQLAFGISTLLYAVPIGLAALHQGFSFVLFGSLLFNIFLLYTRKNDILRYE